MLYDIIIYISFLQISTIAYWLSLKPLFIVWPRWDYTEVRSEHMRGANSREHGEIVMKEEVSALKTLISDVGNGVKQ